MDNHILEIDGVRFGFAVFVFDSERSRDGIVKCCWVEQPFGDLSFRSHDRLFYLVETVSEILEIGMCIKIVFIRDVEVLAKHLKDELVAGLYP